MSATRMGTGAPPNAARLEDPGGRTVRSAPIPTWRDLLSSRIPSASPTIIRISVTSTATAKMLMMDRMGRWTRLATIILFIGFLLYLHCVPRRGGAGLLGAPGKPAFGLLRRRPAVK